jgi:hypothetical protein
MILNDKWAGEIQVDFGPIALGERLIIRDAYLQYRGFQDHGVTITLGNQKTPFSRSLLASASRRSLVERPLTGDKTLGAPGRAIALRVDGRNHPGTFEWSGALASALHSPNAQFLRIDGLAESREDWNEGVLVSGRGEWHPLGAMVRDQSVFEPQDLRVAIGAATYWWINDGDRNLYTVDDVSTSTENADLDRSFGLEVSGGLRASRVSVDAEFHRVTGDTIDPLFTGGLFDAGHTRLFKYAVECGYMIVPARVEVVGAFDLLDISARDAFAKRPAFGLNYYVMQHRLKFQVMHRETFNVLGVSGERSHATFVQAQFIY